MKTDFNNQIKAKIKMIIPVRCFTCNGVIGHMYNNYARSVEQYLSEGKTEMVSCDTALCDLGLGPKRYCCRRMIQTHVNLIDELLLYANNPFEKQDIDKPVDNGKTVNNINEFDHQNTIDEDFEHIDHEDETPMEPDDDSDVGIDYNEDDD